MPSAVVFLTFEPPTRPSPRYGIFFSTVFRLPSVLTKGPELLTPGDRFCFFQTPNTAATDLFRHDRFFARPNRTLRRSNFVLFFNIVYQFVYLPECPDGGIVRPLFRKTKKHQSAKNRRSVVPSRIARHFLTPCARVQPSLDH